MQHEYAFSLPHPDAVSAAHSERCADYIRARIRDAGGSISFAEFMHYALYAPGLGYYSAGTRKFGDDGDFVTAPEISPLFGRVIARQSADVLRSVPGGTVLEFGAGSGTLALEVLRTLEELGATPAEYRIMEVSADLREELGIDAFGSAEETPATGALGRIAGRLMRPLVPLLARRMMAKGPPESGGS